MSYNKTNWNTGDVITAEKLNNMEDGIADAGKLMVVNFTYDNDSWSADKTFEEIIAAFVNNIPIIGWYSRVGSFTCTMSISGESKIVFTSISVLLGESANVAGYWVMEIDSDNTITEHFYVGSDSITED